MFFYKDNNNSIPTVATNQKNFIFFTVPRSQPPRKIGTCDGEVIPRLVLTIAQQLPGNPRSEAAGWECLFRTKQKGPTLSSWSFCFVRKMGLEPTRCKHHKILSLARLPIPTLPQTVVANSRRLVYNNKNSIKRQQKFINFFSCFTLIVQNTCYNRCILHFKSFWHRGE